HRLAECLLVDVIGLEWEQVHAEACRWEHVMSEAVERRLLRLLRHPTESPYGNPIPGLEELGGANPAAPRPSAPAAAGSTVSLGDLRPGPDGVSAVVRRIGEPVQADGGLLAALRRAGVRPGAV
ncbi:dihydrofolate reductase, partial [Streptomyces sp. SID5926]|nr:dihydrofolate reductase [Streptomyces sp. SID5926]